MENIPVVCVSNYCVSSDAVGVGSVSRLQRQPRSDAAVSQCGGGWRPRLLRTAAESPRFCVLSGRKWLAWGSSGSLPTHTHTHTHNLARISCRHGTILKTVLLSKKWNRKITWDQLACIEVCAVGHGSNRKERNTKVDICDTGDSKSCSQTVFHTVSRVSDLRWKLSKSGFVIEMNRMLTNSHRTVFLFSF